MYRNLLFLVICLSGAVHLTAQRKKQTDNTVFAKTISADDLKKHLFVVAGPEMEGRETATPGQQKAASYIEEQFKRIGLKPGNGDGYQLFYPVFQDSLVNASIEVNGKRFEVNKDFTVSLTGNNNSTLMASEIVFAGQGISDSVRNDFEGLDVHGKIVLVQQPPPPQPSGNGNGGGARMRVFYPYAAQEAALKNGAVAVLQIRATGSNRSNFSRGNQYVNGFKKTILPNLYVINEDVAEAIMGKDLASVKEGKTAAIGKTYTVNVSIDFQKQVKKNASSNVLGLLEGTDKKDEYLVLTAHYDHLGTRDNKTIYYGADDDGSGTVSILKIAEAFAKAKEAGFGPRRSIVFMTVSGEEKGLWGSAFYSDHPIFPLEKTTANLNIDMIGRRDPKRKTGDSTNYVYIVGDDKLSSDLKPISEAINSKYTKLELDYKYNDPKDPENIYYRSDHYNFAKKGVPVIFYFNGTHADYHRPTDTPDKIDYPQMAKRAQLVFYTAWEMANREAMLKRDIPLEAAFR
jgi:Zn-dependent M28 family amino/carboxypeptidase